LVGYVLTRFFADGFFDAGMLMQALKAKENAGERPSEKVVQRREVGKRLRLMEY
jgi:carnitine O-acetyltransferase